MSDTMIEAAKEEAAREQEAKDKIKRLSADLKQVRAELRGARDALFKRDAAQDSLSEEYAREREALFAERDAAIESYEGQKRNTLAFMREKESDESLLSSAQNTIQVLTQRAVSAEAKNTSLLAQVAAMREALQFFVGHIVDRSAEGLPDTLTDGWQTYDYDKALAAAPDEAVSAEAKNENLLRLKKEVDEMSLRAITAEAKNTSLLAQVARMAEALIHLTELKRHKDKEGKTEEYLKQQPVAWENANKALAAAPDEAQKLVRLVEAVGKMSMAIKLMTPINPHDIEEAIDAHRDLRGEKV